jgi:hypothetical protein
LGTSLVSTGIEFKPWYQNKTKRIASHYKVQVDLELLIILRLLSSAGIAGEPPPCTNKTLFFFLCTILWVTEWSLSVAFPAPGYFLLPNQIIPRTKKKVGEVLGVKRHERGSVLPGDCEHLHTKRPERTDSLSLLLRLEEPRESAELRNFFLVSQWRTASQFFWPPVHQRQGLTLHFSPPMGFLVS